MQCILSTKQASLHRTERLVTPSVISAGSLHKCHARHGEVCEGAHHENFRAWTIDSVCSRCSLYRSAAGCAKHSAMVGRSACTIAIAACCRVLNMRAMQDCCTFI